MEDKRPGDNLYKIFSKESFLYNGAQASGDNHKCCRLCGRERNLHSFGDTYNKEGVEQRYSQLVNECFGVEVKPSDELVCNKCIYQLHITERFRAQVVAAFASPGELPDSKVEAGEKVPKCNAKKKSTVELVKKITEANIDRKWRFQRKSLYNMNIQPKRTNLYCTLCRQRYPMMVPFEGWKNFVCSRCKKSNVPHAPPLNKRNISSNNMKDRFGLGNVSEIRGNRQFSLFKKPLHSRGDLTNSKFQLRPTVYMYADRTSAQCCNARVQNDYRCDVCGKDMKTWDLLNRHTRTHTSQPLYRCDVCRRVFKERTLFQKHYLNHGKAKVEKKLN